MPEMLNHMFILENRLEIPDVKAKDIAEIKRLLNEEHIYLMKNEAGIESENLL